MARRSATSSLWLERTPAEMFMAPTIAPAPFSRKRTAPGDFPTAVVRLTAPEAAAIIATMSGHSHWATIKHKKGTADARRGKLWSKLCRAIQISAKEGGGNPDMNLKLANAILDARAESVPNDNITRSIKRGTGELEGISYEQVTYEGYGPGGVAFMIDALTDNKNRSAAEMRKMFENSNGNLAGAGAVRFMFQAKGLILIPKSAAGE